MGVPWQPAQEIAVAYFDVPELTDPFGSPALDAAMLPPIPGALARIRGECASILYADDVGVECRMCHDQRPRDDQTGRWGVLGSYEAVAGEYARRIAGELAHKPVDRGLLDRFAERVAGRGRVCDVGCGPGHVARYLNERGVDVCASISRREWSRSPPSSTPRSISSLATFSRFRLRMRTGRARSRFTR